MQNLEKTSMAFIPGAYKANSLFTILNRPGVGKFVWNPQTYIELDYEIKYGGWRRPVVLKSKLKNKKQADHAIKNIIELINEILIKNENLDPNVNLIGYSLGGIVGFGMIPIESIIHPSPEAPLKIKGGVLVLMCAYPHEHTMDLAKESPNDKKNPLGWKKIIGRYNPDDLVIPKEKTQEVEGFCQLIGIPLLWKESKAKEHGFLGHGNLNKEDYEFIERAIELIIEDHEQLQTTIRMTIEDQES